MGDLCGGSHVPEECDLFIGLSQSDRLAVVGKKRLCYLCFRHADSQPCQLQSSLPACSIGGCMPMHSRLLHGALQREETRIIVIEVEVDLEAPGEDEEFYAADFEILGQEDEDENEEMIPDEEALPPDSLDGEHDEEPSPYEHPGEDRPRLCQQPVRREVEGDLTGMISEEEALPPDGSYGEHDKEPSPYEHPDEDRPRLCQQLVQLEVDGELTTLHTLYDWETPNTLVRAERARRIGLQSVRIPRQTIKGYQGVGTITDCVYHVPLVDADGNVQVIRAYGVEEITAVARPSQRRYSLSSGSPHRGWRQEQDMWSCS